MKVILKLLFLFIISTPLFGSNENTAADYVAAGDSLLQIGNLDEAKDKFKDALGKDKKNINARFGLGRIKIEEEEWADANDEFEKVLDIDPQNKLAHYYRGICYRENGKFKVLLQRKWEWNRSKKHFFAVMEQDSAFRDVLLQYAILLQYRHKFDKAIHTAHRQIRLRPDLVEPQIRIFRIYQYFIFQDVDRDLINLENTLSSSEIIDWLEKQTYDHARFMIAEKYRSMDEYTQAVTVLNDMLQTPLSMPRQAIYLSLARIYYARLHAEKAESYFWRAVDEMDDDVEAGIVFQDVKYILTDQEYAEYQSSKTIEQKKAFFRHLWAKRNPTPIAAINYRLSEHYHRLLYAEENYTYRGFRSRFSQVDRMGYIHYPASYKLNEEFNDKGLIYIRHGKPDEQVVTQGRAVPVNESWMYYETATSPKMIFHFTPERESKYWRFTPIIENQQMIRER
ncbi:GWxTD domain-containing protein, partial [candidate division KSB1 bacterium]|nr:GWxTD domain-containing protein [candidate division KSB1 bacterium]